MAENIAADTVYADDLEDEAIDRTDGGKLGRLLTVGTSPCVFTSAG